MKISTLSKSKIKQVKNCAWMLRVTLFASTMLTLSACQIVDFNRADGGLRPSGNPVTFDKVATNDALVQIGAAQHPRILKTYGGEYNDPKLERMLAKIMGKLTAVSTNPNQSYRVTILNSPSVNAFALPGGYVYVTRGMLALANDSSEVAAVIAHEMSHITANHGVLRQQVQEDVNLTNRVVSEVLSDHTGEREVALQGKLRLAQFSRNQELQADALGIKMLGEAGYDPFASPRFLSSMEAYESFRNVSGATDARLDFLANHPATPQRIQLAIAEARKIGAPGIGTTDRNDFLNGIDGMVFGDTANEGYVRGNQFIHPKLGVSFTVPQGFSIDNSSSAVIASGRGDIAIRFDGVRLPTGLSAVDYIQSGWVSGLDRASVQNITINGMQAARARASNETWQFDVVVIPVKDKVFRFLTAAPKNTTQMGAIANVTTNSFTTLSPRQISAIKPLRIHVITARAGDTVASLSLKMQGTQDKEKLLRTINALSTVKTISEGERVKIIAE